MNVITVDERVNESERTRESFGQIFRFDMTFLVIFTKRISAKLSKLIDTE